MALMRNQGNTITAGPGAEIFTNWTYPGATDHGPQYVSAYFVGAPDNYGTVTTVQTSVNSFYTDQYGYYWPLGISYSSIMRNDSASPVIITVNIGNFE